MTLSEKSAYLKGLMEGMKLDTETNEGKLISEIISMLQDVAENVSDLEEVVDGTETLYEVKCPTCGEVITIDEEMLDEGATTCPNCGEELEFDMEDEEPEDK